MKTATYTATFTIAVACALLFTACGDSTPGKETQEHTGKTATSGNDVMFSFAFLGCNRIDRHDKKNPNTNASTANLPELQRTFSEIAALNPKPVFLFFTGDLVLGLDTTKNVLSKELKEWVKQYYDTSFSPISTSGIKLIAMPGNHEALYYNDAKDAELPWKRALSIWMNEMSGFMPAQPLNRIGGKDSMDNLQTYSFNYSNTHFIVLNTDTYNDSILEGRLPVDWAIADMQAARKDTSIKHIFLLGHKPCYDISGQLDGPHNTMANYITQKLWPAMENSKAEAMLSAHAHVYYRYQPNSGKSYQVVAGNGGSPYEHSLDSAHQFFGYTIVNVLKNGNVTVKSMGRSVPGGSYLESIPATLPTTLRDSVNIGWGTTAPVWKNGLLQ